MTPIRITLTLLLLVAAVLLAAGCVGEKEAGKTTIATSDLTVIVSTSPQQAITRQPPVLTQSPTPCRRPDNVTIGEYQVCSGPPDFSHCYSVGNGSYWIRLEPLPDIRRGDPIYINGTTNAPENSVLTIQGYIWRFRDTKITSPRSSFASRIKMRAVDRCTNAFSSHFDSSHMKPDTYTLAVISDIKYLGYNRNFNITDNPSLKAPSSDRSFVFPEQTSIAILPPLVIPSGKKLSITGYKNDSSPVTCNIYPATVPASSPACTSNDYYSSQICPGEVFTGVLFPVRVTGQNISWVSLTTGTENFDPGSYIAYFRNFGSDNAVEVLFNVTPDSAGTFQ